MVFQFLLQFFVAIIEQAVKMASEAGATKAARDLGVPVDTLYGWIRKAKQYGERAHVGSGNKRNGGDGDEKSRLTS